MNRRSLVAVVTAGVLYGVGYVQCRADHGWVLRSELCAVETVEPGRSASHYVLVFFPAAKLEGFAWFVAPSLMYSLERVAIDAS